MQYFLYLIEALVNVKKLFQIKRYAVVFFDMKALPVEGDRITVGKLVATFHDPEKEDIKEAIAAAKLEEAPGEMAVVDEAAATGEVWQCRKCGTPNAGDPAADVLRCAQCGFRTTK